jgi:hypothetical protein
MKELPPLNANKNDRQSGWGAPKSPQSDEHSMEAEQKSEKEASEEEEEEYSIEEEGVEEDEHSQQIKSESEDDEEDYFGGVSRQKSVQPTVAKSNTSAPPVKSLFSAPASKPAPKPAVVEDDGYGDDFEDYGDDFDEEDDGFMSSNKAKSSGKSKASAAQDSDEIEIEEDIEEDISVGEQEVHIKNVFVDTITAMN